MGVENFGERRPFEWDDRDALALEALEKPPELSAQDQMTRGGVDEAALQPLSHGAGHCSGRIRLAREREGGAQTFGRSRVDQEVPIEGFTWTGRRAAPIERAHALDDPACLEAQRPEACARSIEAGMTAEPATCAAASACSQFAAEGP